MSWLRFIANHLLELFGECHRLVIYSSINGLMLGSKLIHVNKRGLWKTWPYITYVLNTMVAEDPDVIQWEHQCLAQHSADSTYDSWGILNVIKILSCMSNAPISIQQGHVPPYWYHFQFPKPCNILCYCDMNRFHLVVVIIISLLLTRGIQTRINIIAEDKGPRTLYLHLNSYHIYICIYFRCHLWVFE